jgi:hypothetical protein
MLLLAAVPPRAVPAERTVAVSMNKNVGMIDRLVRIVFGVALIAYAIPIGFPSGDMAAGQPAGSCLRR